MPKDLHPNDPANGVAEKILDSAFKIHRQYGAGLLENAYEHLLAYELVQNQNLKVETQKTLPLIHEGTKIDAGYRLDMLVDDKVIVEIKSVQKVLPVHEAQLLTYLKLTDIRLGLLLNFNTQLLKDGIKRFIL
ncbi:MAG: GxxExxY protein [Alphaproteobacteria bacterium]|nr:GxxExxY protein [Alphaproteobacteria bacterium]